MFTFRSLRMSTYMWIRGLGRVSWGITTQSHLLFQDLVTVYRIGVLKHGKEQYDVEQRIQKLRYSYSREFIKVSQFAIWASYHVIVLVHLHEKHPCSNVRLCNMIVDASVLHLSYCWGFPWFCVYLCWAFWLVKRPRCRQLRHFVLFSGEGPLIASTSLELVQKEELSSLVGAPDQCLWRGRK